ncbi:putative indole-3-pyruvate monooxygenase YUCCA5 [Acorus calamus]|uniref:indole-3-pyruvate monooxygenase n=1 Tax=Acorus calamus TaxID=4465 RepID=A0AAV9D2M2_ACOCL|nr:putative indole-3-pyruvate monooxygenase YUCCA5 [Acorus calamus]
MSKFFPCHWVDSIVLFLCYLKFGNTSEFGFRSPSKGPFYLKDNTPFYPVVDVGTVDKIKSGQIQVLLSLASVKGSEVRFVDGKTLQFDAIVFATGYKRTVKNWLKDDGEWLNKNSQITGRARMVSTVLV